MSLKSDIASQLMAVHTRIKKRVDNAGYEALQETGKETVVEIRRRLNTGNRTGNVYRRGKRTRRASAAGEPPKTDTGKLAKSVRQFGKVKRTKHTNTLQLRAGNSKVVYASYLEFGTDNMDARPFMRPSLENMKKRWWVHFRINLKRANLK